MKLQELLRDVAEGRIQPPEAERYLGTYGLLEVGLNKLDTVRQARTALPEVVFGRGKSIGQLREIVGALLDRELPVLVTRVEPEKAATLCSEFPLRYDTVSKLLRGRGVERVHSGRVAVLSAGSADLPVAEEAAGTLEFFGIPTTRWFDSGVAGLHRLFAGGEVLAAADVMIVVAGMDGALPAVVAGTFRSPVIAVPTSVGYGASFEGIGPLLTMMSACAPGITVVNIDNGFGAAMAAHLMLQMAVSLAGREKTVRPAGLEDE